LEAGQIECIANDLVIMIDLLAGVDPNDVHFRLVRLPAPPVFEVHDVEVTYVTEAVRRQGPGSLRADLFGVSASMSYDDPLQPGEIRSLGEGGAGKLIAAERYGALSGASAEGTWTANGALVVGRSGAFERPKVTFRLADVIVRGPGVGDPAFTREIFYGPRLQFLTGCFATPISSTELHYDRTEEIAYKRRITLRDLREESNDTSSATAVVYDGPPTDGARHRAVWLAASLLAGAALHPAVVEIYDGQGTLLERRYRPGVQAGMPGHPPFHVHYAKYPRGVFATLCERIAALLESDFPIDVVISHLHDANDGSIERRMQSGLFAIHAASEAWNRLHERTMIVDGALWKWLKHWVAAAARGVADAFSSTLGESVENSVMNANNTSSGSRLRLFFKRIRLAYAGKTKKAIDLRNKLFHDGYLQRRFSTLEAGDQQERYDDLQRIREFTLRMVFAVCDMDVNVHSLLNLYGTVASRDLPVEERAT
jgi:hypothetical protein